jgi:4-hydroxy-3-methylbut-2-enyl diphosphate reductase
LVHRVHREGARYAREDRDVVLIGHAGHPEVVGTLGRLDGRSHLVSTIADVATLDVANPDKVAYITQTTLSVDDTRAIIDALAVRFPAITGPDTSEICYATQNRQRAVAELAGMVDLVLVVGARNSSNSNRLREIAEQRGIPAHLLEEPEALRPEWLEGVRRVGITAGASAPDDLVQGLIETLRGFGPVDLWTLPGVKEDTHFKLPAQLL